MEQLVAALISTENLLIICLAVAVANLWRRIMMLEDSRVDLAARYADGISEFRAVLDRAIIALEKSTRSSSDGD